MWVGKGVLVVRWGRLLSRGNCRETFGEVVGLAACHAEW